MSSYDRLAAEYYDAARHPTCADFRDATRLLLDGFLDRTAPAAGASLELGAGMSLVAEAYAARGAALAQLTITDASPGMLAHSEPWARRGVRLVAAPVETLDLGAARFARVFACLGDPFNGPLLWRRVAEWLLPGGACFFSTPAFAWTSRFRALRQSGGDAVAEFLVAGEPVYVPSHVAPEPAQRDLIEAAGLRLAATRHVARRDLPGGARSAKITLPEIADDLPIVTAYWVEQPG